MVPLAVGEDKLDVLRKPANAPIEATMELTVHGAQVHGVGNDASVLSGKGKEYGYVWGVRAG
jgi:hypothetical protein